MSGDQCEGGCDCDCDIYSFDGDDGDYGWTPRTVYWNTLGTLVGAISGLAALAVALVALLRT